MKVSYHAGFLDVLVKQTGLCMQPHKDDDFKQLLQHSAQHRLIGSVQGRAWKIVWLSQDWGTKRG